MEEAGVHVVYGHPALKTHAKCILVVRREGDGVRHYVHVGTGNYHPQTARLYTDFGLFTCDERLGADAADMFNFLTGFGRPRAYREALIAPTFLRDGILEPDRADRRRAQGGPRGAHRDEDERARRPPLHPRAVPGLAGRGPGRPQRPRHLLPGPRACPGSRRASRSRSVVGRFLEHSRIYAFFRGGEEPTVLIGSADLMPRNLDKRVELVAPVEDEAIRDDLLDALERCLADTANAWELHGRRDVGAPAAPRTASSRATCTRSSWSGTPPGPPRARRPREPARRGRPGAHPRARARQPPARRARRRRQRGRAAQGLVARRRRQRRPAGDVGPLLGPHPDRHEHRAAADAAAVPPRRRARRW